MAALPLKVPRLITLALTAAFGAIGGSVGLNAIVKRNQAVAAIKHEVAGQGITLNVDTFDLLRPGIVLAAGCAALGVIAVTWLGLLLLDTLRSRKASTTTTSAQPISSRTLPLQWMSLAFMAIWIFACNVATTYIAKTGHAKTKAYLAGRQLPQALVDATQRSLGVNPDYWSNDYVRLQVIPPWATLLFCILAAITAFVASRRRGTVATETARNERISSESPITEKASEAQRETV